VVLFFRDRQKQLQHDFFRFDWAGGTGSGILKPSTIGIVTAETSRRSPVDRCFAPVHRSTDNTTYQLISYFGVASRKNEKKVFANWLPAIGYRLLAVGCWLLAIAYYLLNSPIGYWLLPKLLPIAYCLLPIAC
jgi:hypothetical protein